MNDLKILTADYRVDYLDLSTHRYKSQNYEWEYSRNSQKNNELDKKKRNLTKKKINLDKKKK